MKSLFILFILLISCTNYNQTGKEYYNSGLQKHQNGELNWDEMTDLMLQVADNSNEIDVEGFIAFIKSNEDNDLPNDSSGSFMTAIIDLDNILTPFENDLASLAEIDMEEYEVLERKIEEFYA